MGRGQQSQPAASSSSTVPKPRRQRASPSRLVKLYNDLTQSQKKRIRAIGFGGLLKIASKILPLVFPGRGRISVNADSVCRAFGLPNNGDEVKYELDVGAINFINATKMGKRRSFKGCLLVLVILYVDSFLVDNVQIPSTMPRVTAWSRKLLDQVIKLDTKHDGSFGKLKLKGSSYSTPQPSLFHMDDIRRFVSSMVPSGISDQTRCTSYMLRLKC
ncbi:unnamed protein product [Miscanthus lutarioriparius]|uniref:Uncharacterized protein n=1 Tax=Miscanthus lutarioriparius TaxID=422564 RepID=A0A811RVK8_9POAL|nr:unnamed protein product [Miscanthus lutarioriparius]